MIEVKGLTKRFGLLTAVEDVSFSVATGEIFGFLGPNGAGKTTMVRILACLISKSSGEARIGEYDVGRPADAMSIRKMVGLVSDNVGMYEDLSAVQNLEFFGKLYETPTARRRENIERLLKLLGLWEERDRTVATFSKGMKQKLAIARALVHDPQVLFLDEPTANLDPAVAKTVRDFIVELKREKKTVFLNTHNLDEAQRICDRIGILQRRLIATGTPSELEGSLGARRTVVQLEHVTAALVQGVEARYPSGVTRQGDRLSFEVTDPEKENPAIVEAIVAAGGRVQYVTELHPGLEDVYLKLVESRG